MSVPTQRRAVDLVPQLELKQPGTSAAARVRDRAAARRASVRRVADPAAALLDRYAVDALRVSLGVVFLLFGALKFVPGLSPAEPLVVRTLDALSFGLVGAGPAMLLTAVMEVFIGLTLVTGVALRLGLLALAGAMAGILSPLVLFFDDLVLAGGPTLEAQYVFKDVVLVAAALVVAARVLRPRA